MGDTLLDKIIILTSPVGLVLLFLGACIMLWEDHIWCNKRWYYKYYDYKMTIRAIKKGLTEQQKKGLTLWINRNPNHPYVEQIKAKLKSV